MHSVEHLLRLDKIFQLLWAEEEKKEEKKCCAGPKCSRISTLDQHRVLVSVILSLSCFFLLFILQSKFKAFMINLWHNVATVSLYPSLSGSLYLLSPTYTE